MASQNFRSVYACGGGENDFMNIVILFLTGLISGIISGMGIGGGTILIPVLGIFLGYGQKAAQNINLIYFIPTAVTALITHIKNDRVEKKIVFKVASFGVLGAVCGASLAGMLNGELLRRLFGFFLIIMGLSEIFKKNRTLNKREVKNN